MNSFGTTDNGVFTIGLQLNDGTNIATDSTTLTVNNTAVAMGQKIDIRFVARPVGTVDNSNEVILLNLNAQSITGLKPQASKTFSKTVSLPQTLASDAYNIIADVHSGLSVGESDENNNAVMSSHSMTVATGFVDPQGELGASTLLDAAVLGTSSIGKLPVTVFKRGNTVVAMGQKIDL